MAEAVYDTLFLAVIQRRKKAYHTILKNQLSTQARYEREHRGPILCRTMHQPIIPSRLREVYSFNERTVSRCTQASARVAKKRKPLPVVPTKFAQAAPPRPPRTPSYRRVVDGFFRHAGLQRAVARELEEVAAWPRAEDVASAADSDGGMLVDEDIVDDENDINQDKTLVDDNGEESEGNGKVEGEEAEKKEVKDQDEVDEENEKVDEQNGDKDDDKEVEDEKMDEQNKEPCEGARLPRSAITKKLNRSAVKIFAEALKRMLRSQPEQELSGQDVFRALGSMTKKELYKCIQTARTHAAVENSRMLLQTARMIKA